MIGETLGRGQGPNLYALFSPVKEEDFERMGKRAPSINVPGRTKQTPLTFKAGRQEMGVFHKAASADTETCCWVPERTGTGGFLTLSVLRDPRGILLYLFLSPAQFWVKVS